MTTANPRSIAQLRNETEITIANAAVKSARYLAAIADETNKGNKARIDTAKYIVDHTIGKARQKIEHSGTIEHAHTLKTYSNDELKQLLTATTNNEHNRAVDAVKTIDAVVAHKTTIVDDVVDESPRQISNDERLLWRDLR
jgi:hypothetical protein